MGVCTVLIIGGGRGRGAHLSWAKIHYLGHSSEYFVQIFRDKLDKVIGNVSKILYVVQHWVTSSSFRTGGVEEKSHNCDPLSKINQEQNMKMIFF